MLKQNAEVIRRAFDAFERRDKAAWIDVCDPELEVAPVGAWPESPSIRGADAAWEFFLASDDPWESGRFEVTELIDAGKDLVVAHQRRDMRGKTSGVEVEYDYWLLATFRGGKAVRLQWFDSRREALDAAGGGQRSGDTRIDESKKLEQDTRARE